MSSNPTYQAATEVAPLVEAHFARHIEEARRLGEDDIAPQPDAESVAAIINATFWASFRPEEGRFPKSRSRICHANRLETRWFLHSRYR